MKRGVPTVADLPRRATGETALRIAIGADMFRRRLRGILHRRPEPSFDWSGRGSVALVALVSVLSVSSPVIAVPSTDGDGNRATHGAGATRGAGAIRGSNPSVRGQSSRLLHVRFRDGAGVRLVGNALSASGIADLAELDDFLERNPGVRFERLFAASEQEVGRYIEMANRRSGRKTPDLNLWFRVRLPEDADEDGVLEELRELQIVDTAYTEPLPTPLPATPNFAGKQAYTSPAPAGIHANAAAALAGGNGDHVRIIDLEYSWNTAHEDLAAAANGLIPNGTPVDPFIDTNHGTAVLGQLIATDNGFGVTGIVPAAGIGMVNVANAEIGYVLQDALLLAANELSPGDVILIEQQHDLQYPFGVYVPVEYFEAYWDTIRTVTNAGIIVIEAAGNGNNDLDALGPIEDSGAIIVGAGEAPTGDGFSCTVGAPRSRAPFSNYGSRVDVQGWGECVVTTGYGDLHLGSGTDSAYTAMFSGTSSASPIVAGAAAILSSVIEANTGNAATPAAIRTLLKSTGTPQDFSAGGPVGNIGPLPNVAVALQQLGYVDARPLVARPVQTLATGMPIADGDAVPVDLSWSATDSDGVTGYKLKRRINGGRWKLVTLPSAAATSIVQNLPRGNSYQYAVAAQDATGLWSDWRIGRRFKVALRSEEHASISYTGGWKRVASSSAVGGYVKVSGTRDAYSTVAFSGSSIAWVATMASNRGEALVWVDQVLLGAYDLHSSTNTPRTIIVARDLPSGSHTMTVWVVGTDGRPKIDVDAFVILK